MEWPLCPIEPVQLAGQGRASLLRWIAAAHVVQRAVRVWRFRQGLIAGGHMRSGLQAAATQLQAMWRGRQPFRSYQALRHAAICTQVINIAVLFKLQSLHADLCDYTVSVSQVGKHSEKLQEESFAAC